MSIKGILRLALLSIALVCARPTVAQEVLLIGDRVWHDLDRNGVQDPYEPGLEGALVQLRCPDGTILTQTTDASGYYLFRDLLPGRYEVTVTPPAGFVVSPCLVPGVDPELDSNENPSVVILSFEPWRSYKSIDFGFHEASAGVFRIGDRVWVDINQNGIQDPGEPGLAGAVVTLTDANGTPITVTTGGDGTYVFADLASGVYAVSVVAPAGHVPAPPYATGSTPENDSNANPETVTITDADVLDIDFGFCPQGPTYAIGDKVWDDVNQNGIQDPGEAGLAGAVVTLTDASGASQSLTTGGDGTYRFTNLPSGSYTISVVPPAGVVPSPAHVAGSTPDNDSDPNPASVELTDADLLNVDFGYHVPDPTYAIGDKVWKDTNLNGIQDPEEPGLAGALVTLTRPDGTLRTLTTPEGGAYRFEGLPNGQYQISVTPPPGGYVASPSYAVGSTPDNDSNTNPSTVDVLNADVLNIDFGFGIPVMTLGDRVWNDLNKNGLQEPGEPGLADVVVRLTCPDGSIRTSWTDPSGTYLFPNLAPGSYLLTVTAPTGYLPSPSNVGNDDGLDSDGSPVSVTLTHTPALTYDFGYYRQTYAIGDRVWKDINANGIQDAGEPGLAGVPVNLTGGAIKTVTTDANGNYAFTDLLPGSYTVTVAPPAGYVASPKNAAGSTVDSDSNGSPAAVTLTNAPIANVDFGYYQPTYALGDRVWKDTNANGIQDAGEPGLAGVTVKLSLPNGTTQTRATDASGNYTFTGLVSGSYTVTVMAPAGYAASPTNAAGSTANNDSNGSPAAVTLTNASLSNVDFGYYQPTYSLGDRVWNDLIPNGIQDTGEPGLQGVVVKLTFPNGTTTTTSTNANGHYQFTGLPAGTYTVSISSLPVGTWIASPKHVGTNDNLDSDGSPVTVNLTAHTTSIDFGYTPQSNPAGGHIDVDTSSKWYAPNKGTTDGHVHEYDDKYDVSHVDWRALKDGKLRNIQNVVPAGRAFRIVVANGKLNPGAMIVVNNTVTPAASFVETGQVYTTANLSTFKVFFNQNTMTGILGTETKAVRANKPGKYGEWRNGALTIQAIDASKFAIDPKTGVVINNGGLLWEGTIFWHHHCGTYGEPGWNPNCPPD